MKSRWITIAVLVLALVFAASPAIAGGQGAGEPAKVQSGGDTVAPGAGDVLQDRTQDRTQDKLQDGSCSEDCDGPSTCAEDGSATKTQTRTQTQTQSRLNESGETSGVATMARETTRARIGQADEEVVVDSDAVVPEPEETMETTRAGNLLGSVIQTMAQFAARVFAWIGLV